MYLCTSVYLCMYDNFWKLWRTKFIFGQPAPLHQIRIKFVYEGHRVKVKVTATKARKFPFPQCVTSIINNSGSIENRSLKFANSLTWRIEWLTAIFVTWSEIHAMQVVWEGIFVDNNLMLLRVCRPIFAHSLQYFCKSGLPLHLQITPKNLDQY